jgi:hypothetical protein
VEHKELSIDSFEGLSRYSVKAPAGEYTIFYGQRNENHELSTGFLLRKRIISAVKMAEFVSDNMSHIILRAVDRCKSYSSQLLNIHNISDIMQTEIHTAEPLVPGPSHLEVEISIGKLKKYKSPGSDQISAELYQAGGETLMSVIHKLITSIWNKEEMPDQWKESIIVPVHKIGDKTDCNNYRGISLLSTSYKILSNILLSRLIPYIDEIIEDHQCGF